MSIRAVLIACAAVTVGTLALSSPVSVGADEGFSMLSTGQVEKEMGAPDVRIFDANGPEEYANGHVPGAVLVDRKSLEGMLPTDKSTRLIFYCKNPH